jgi:hypothetical protein
MLLCLKVIYRTVDERCSRTILVTAQRTRRFLRCLVREEQQRPGARRAAQRQKEGLAVTLARAIIASPHSHEEESSWC